jgi:hypothetical protein
LEILKWGQVSGYDLDITLNWNTIQHVASNGHIEVVKYLRLIRIEWDERTCINAARTGRSFMGLYEKWPKESLHKNTKKTIVKMMNVVNDKIGPYIEEHLLVGTRRRGMV